MKQNLSIRWASFRDFEIVKTLIEKGSVTLAAEILGISQPAVSKAIANIEGKSGKTLFLREKGKLIPTKDALFVYEEIQNIFTSLERIDDSNWNIDSKQVIRIITTPTIAYSFLAPLTANYMKERGNIKVIFSVVNSVDMLNEIREGRADIALGNANINNNLADLKEYPLFKSKIICILHKNHELADKEKLTIHDLNYRNLIMYTARNILSSKLRKIFSVNGVEPNIIAEVSDSMAALHFVRENIGISLVPEFPTCNLFDENIIVKQIDMDIYDEMMLLVLNNSLNPYCIDYIEYVQGWDK
ncbi:LysR family transcriptional regulator [Edaphovirga cremea]|uniref:LysR family transcriptional regulator n=1 Tax=Edaphovirga cremea TaxID=2267246 RepID=UPI000DEFAE6E|nr:LysR family transcriptional regulator [Edaphovirga cremea]